MYQDEAELLVETINQTAGLSPTQGLFSNNPEYEHIFSLTNKVCNQLRSCQKQKHKVRCIHDKDYQCYLLLLFFSSSSSLTI